MDHKRAEPEIEWIKERLLLARKRVGLSREKAADLIGCHWRAIEEWEKPTNTRTPDAYTVRKMAYVYGVAVAYLLAESDHETGLPTGATVVDLERVALIRRARSFEHIKTIPAERGFTVQIPFKPRLILTPEDLKEYDDARQRLDQLQPSK